MPDLIPVKTQEIFPSTKTSTINKLITENSLTRLLNRLMDVDGYIISSEIQDFTLSDYNYVDITEDIRQSNLEICIRGYYFNLGTYNDVLGNINTLFPGNNSNDTLNPGDMISAVIFVDSSNPDYPELNGQDSFVEINVDVTGEDIQLESGFIASSVKFYREDGTYTVASEGEISISGVISAEVLQAEEAVRVNYYIQDSTSCIWFYVNAELDDIPMPSEGLVPYKLDLFYVESVEGGNTFQIPVDSFHKFSSVSIQSIDGGVIKSTE